MSFHHFYPLSFTSKPPSNNRNIVSWLLAKYCMFEQWSSIWTVWTHCILTHTYTHTHLIPHFHIWIHENGWHYTYWRGQGFRQRHFESIFQGGALCISCQIWNLNTLSQNLSHPCPCWFRQETTVRMPLGKLVELCLLGALASKSWSGVDINNQLLTIYPIYILI